MSMEEDDFGTESAGQGEGKDPPWPPEPDGASEPGGRRDGFDGRRKHLFLKTFAKSGCVSDGCRAAGVSRQTFYNHLDSDPDFARHVELALGMASTTVELMAWERGVVGVEEDVYRGGKVVGTRLRRSDSVLRLLLQGANRKKYGPRPGFSRKRLLKHERQQIEKEVRAKIAAKKPSFEEAMKSLEASLEHVCARDHEEKLASGWIRTEEGHWIPPGWVWSGDPTPPAPPPEEGLDAS